jgi:glycosyltransferase involved in cell wall biosynthesis
MKIAHFSVFSPNLSGMYGTVRDLIMAERLQGIDAQLVDYKLGDMGEAYSRVGLVDNGIITISHDWAFEEADILIRHSTLPQPVLEIGKPVVMAMHGRPEYSHMTEHYGSNPVMKILTTHEKDPQYAGYMTFWEEHLLFWNLVMPKREITYIPACVDLKKFHPEGKKYFTANWTGKPNILVADMWREDVTPFSMIEAAEKFRQDYCPTAKLHMFGMPPGTKGFTAQLGQRLHDSDLVGECNTIVPFLDTVYRAADILITPHRIATRIIREATASGLSTVAGTGCKYTPFTADPRNPDAFAFQINNCWQNLKGRQREIRKKVRNVAREMFGPEETGKRMLAFGEKLLKMPKPPKPHLKWQGWSLDPLDWVVLRDFLIGKEIKNVLEIGSGTSTELMDRLGIHVLSYEVDPLFLLRMKHKVGKGVTIKQWNGLFLPEIDSLKYELALIDGPAGPESREPAYSAIANSEIQYVACHDSNRKEDKVFIDKYFGQWKKVAGTDESVQGILILERVK